jgi:hypothetical protein
VSAQDPGCHPFAGTRAVSRGRLSIAKDKLEVLVRVFLACGTD